MLLAIFLVLFCSENCLFYNVYFFLVHWSNLVFELVIIQGWLIVINQYVVTLKYMNRISHK
jgi:hypothetical protein